MFCCVDDVACLYCMFTPLTDAFNINGSRASVVCSLSCCYCPTRLEGKWAGGVYMAPLFGLDLESKVMAQTQLVSTWCLKGQTLNDIKDSVYRESLSRSPLICLPTSDDSLLGWFWPGERTQTSTVSIRFSYQSLRIERQQRAALRFWETDDQI